MFDFDRVTSDSAEQAEVRALTRSIVADHADPARVARLDEAEAFDGELYAELAGAGLVGLGLVGLGVDELAGVDADPRHEIVVLEELGAGPTSMAVCLVVQYMGLRLLAGYGSAEQRSRLLAPLLDGTSRIAFALSEPDGGTDVARAMRTTARRRGGGWELDGTKTWISGASGAEHAIVLARTSDPNPSAVDGISMFVVPLGADGVRIRVLDTVAIHGLDTCEVGFDGVRLEDAAALGTPGSGFRQVLATLNGERLNAASVALGIARGALGASVRYASDRTAFGRSIGAFQALQHSLVDVAIKVEAARGLLNRAAHAAHAAAAGEAPGSEPRHASGRADAATADALSAMAKVAATDAATEAADVGMRVMGGAGLSREFPMQRYFRDARLYTFAPLTNEMLRNFVGERWLHLPRSF